MELLQLPLMVALLAVVHVPMGNYMAHTFTSAKHLKIERFMYRLAGVNPEAQHTWKMYLRNILVLSALSVLGMYILQRIQQWLPMNMGL